MEVCGLGIVLICIKGIKDYVLAWAGIAPPAYPQCFGPKQLDWPGPIMRNIIDAQNRAARIRAFGMRVDELLEENEAIFKRRHRPSPD